MHFYMFNPADFNNSARHLTLPERAIYRDLIDMYYNTEQAIDASDMDSLARRLLCTTTEYRASLDYILAEYFIKRGKRYHHHRIDREIKAYKYKNRNVNGNADSNAVTIDVTQGVTLGNAPCNVIGNDSCNVDDVPMTNAERTRKSRQDRKLMIDSLINAGVSVDKSIKAADLKALYAANIDVVTRNAATDVTQSVTSSNAPCNASNAKNAAITSNYKPLTNNHKPSEREAHTNTGEGIVDNFADVVDNSADNFTATNQLTATNPVDTEIQLPVTTPVNDSVNQPATKADQIRDQRADDIENWEAPTIDEMRGELFRAGKMMQLTDDQYALHIEDFKAHYSEQALLGKPIATESNRKAKLRKWLIGEVDKQAANQARQEKAKGTFNIDNEDWSGTTASRPTQSNSDVPDVFHPSHSMGNTDNEPLFLNGLKRQPFAGMTTDESYALVDRHTQIGESRVAAYDRLLNEMKETA